MDQMRNFEVRDYIEDNTRQWAAIIALDVIQLYSFVTKDSMMISGHAAAFSKQGDSFFLWSWVIARAPP